MKIELVHSEMEAALTAYVISQGIDISGKAVNVHMTAGRGTNGFTANISIVPPEAQGQIEESSNANRSTLDPAHEDALENQNEEQAESEPDNEVTLFP